MHHVGAILVMMFCLTIAVCLVGKDKAKSSLERTKRKVEAVRMKREAEAAKKAEKEEREGKEKKDSEKPKNFFERRRNE